jgi:ribosome-associated protein
MAVTALELARTAATAADDKKATDIVVIDLSKTSDVCDYFVICTAKSKPQANAIVEEVRLKVKTNCLEKPLSVEGGTGATWTLVDYGSVVVHIFRPEARDYFRLERLWGDAPRVDFGFSTQEDQDEAISNED